MTGRNTPHVACAISKLPKWKRCVWIWLCWAKVYLKEKKYANWGYFYQCIVCKFLFHVGSSEKKKIPDLAVTGYKTILTLPLPSRCLVVHPFWYVRAQMFFSLAIIGARGHFFPDNRMLGYYVRDLHFLGLFPIVKPWLLATCSTWLAGSSLLLLDYCCLVSSRADLWLSASLWDDPWGTVPNHLLVLQG